MHCPFVLEQHIVKQQARCAKIKRVFLSQRAQFAEVSGSRLLPFAACIIWSCGCQETLHWECLIDQLFERITKRFLFLMYVYSCVCIMWCEVTSNSLVTSHQKVGLNWRMILLRKVKLPFCDYWKSTRLSWVVWLESLRPASDSVY